MTADVEVQAPVQCPYKTDRGRQCKLLADPVTGLHVDAKPDKHKFVIRKAPGERPVLPQGVRLRAEILPIGQRVKKETPNRETGPRSNEQKQVDADVLAVYNEWVKRNKPKEPENWPQSRYIVPPEAVDAVLDMLRKTTQKDGPVYGKSVRYVKGKHKGGGVIVAFSCADKPPPQDAG